MARVLIAEDSDDYREVLQRLLELEGHQVVACADGAAALAELLHGAAAPELVITDLHMPRMSGLQLVAVVRRQFPTLPILMLTGDTPRAAALAGVPVLSKPMDIGALLATIEQLLEAGRRGTWNPTPR